MNQQELFENRTPISKCSVAQAMSALVKSVRLRHSEDAVYWYLHIATCFPNDYFRLYRRLLIIGAEDCIDATTQRQVYEWYKRVWSLKDKNLANKLATHLILSICSKEDWWQSPSGQKYILGWRLTEEAASNTLPSESPAYYQSDECIAHIVEAATSNNSLEVRTEQALRLHFLGCAAGLNRRTYAQALVDAAINTKNLQARLTAQTHLSFGKDLGSLDENWLGQALWRLLGWELSAKTITPTPDTDAVFAAKLHEVYTATRMPPAWTQDGIHCSGKDRRFAGMLPSMVACCSVFSEYGTLSPALVFEPKHYLSETLVGLIGSPLPTQEPL